jgi:hypothetical protein
VKARDEIGVRERKDVADVERAADGGRRRIDRIDLFTRAAAVEPVDARFLPLSTPLRFQTFQSRLFGQRHPKSLLD